MSTFNVYCKAVMWKILSNFMTKIGQLIVFCAFIIARMKSITVSEWNFS